MNDLATFSAGFAIAALIVVIIAVIHEELIFGPQAVHAGFVSGNNSGYVLGLTTGSEIRNKSITNVCLAMLDPISYGIVRVWKNGTLDAGYPNILDIHNASGDYLEVLFPVRLAWFNQTLVKQPPRVWIR